MESAGGGLIPNNGIVWREFPRAAPTAGRRAYRARATCARTHRRIVARAISGAGHRYDRKNRVGAAMRRS